MQDAGFLVDGEEFQWATVNSPCNYEIMLPASTCNQYTVHLFAHHFNQFSISKHHNQPACSIVQHAPEVLIESLE